LKWLTSPKPCDCITLWNRSRQCSPTVWVVLFHQV